MKRKLGWISILVTAMLIVAIGAYAVDYKGLSVFWDAVFRNGALQLEGSTVDAYKTTLNATDPTDTRTITTPDANGGLTVVDAQSSTQYSAYNDTQTVIPVSAVTPAAGWFSAGKTVELEFWGNIAGGTNSGVSLMFWLGDAYKMTLSPKADGAIGDYKARFIVHASTIATQDIFGELYVSGATTGATIDWATDTNDFSGSTSCYVQMDASSGNTITCEWAVLKTYEE